MLLIACWVTPPPARSHLAWNHHMVRGSHPAEGPKPTRSVSAIAVSSTNGPKRVAISRSGGGSNGTRYFRTRATAEIPSATSAITSVGMVTETPRPTQRIAPRAPIKIAVGAATAAPHFADPVNAHAGGISAAQTMRSATARFNANSRDPAPGPRIRSILRLCRAATPLGR